MIKGSNQLLNIERLFDWMVLVSPVDVSQTGQPVQVSSDQPVQTGQFSLPLKKTTTDPKHFLKIKVEGWEGPMRCIQPNVRWMIEFIIIPFDWIHWLLNSHSTTIVDYGQSVGPARPGTSDQCIITGKWVWSPSLIDWTDSVLTAL